MLQKSEIINYLVKLDNIYLDTIQYLTGLVGPIMSIFHNLDRSCKSGHGSRA